MKYSIKNPMAPLWIKCPYISNGSIGWRMGSGEGDKFEFIGWFDTLSEDDKNKYKELFPSPKSWGDFYGEGEERDEESVIFFPDYSIEDLKTDYLKGKNMEYEFFWGHQPSKSGKIINTCFSQWWKCNFCDDEEEYNCAEQYMMARKALLFDDYEIFGQIMECKEPKKTKALGRKIRNFNEDVWNDYKYNIVYEGNLLKFAQNKQLREYLLSTKDKVIVEASPYDGIWGIKMSRDDLNAKNPLKWRGENLLGFALMGVRKELQRIYKNYSIIGNLENE